MKNKISFFADTVICVTGGVALLYILFTYALPATLPLILGWVFSLIINPLSKKISQWSGANDRFIRGFLCIFFILLFFTAISLTLRRLSLELSSFFEKISQSPQMLTGALEDFISSIRQSKLFSGLEGILSHLGKYATLTDNLLGEITSSALKRISSLLSSIAEGAIAGIPLAFFFTVTFVLSSYYFCVDKEKISDAISKIMPSRLAQSLKKAKNQLLYSLIAYLKSSIILLFITFIEVLLGLFLLRVKYPFIMALLVATVDFLPILGAGVILIPWAIYSLATKSKVLGIGLILLFIFVTVIRKMLEPKIMAKKIGAHPLIIIGSAYIGFKLFGGLGLILTPVVCSAIAPMLISARNISPNPQKRD